jgi:hypothetical protein
VQIPIFDIAKGWKERESGVNEEVHKNKNNKT